MNEPTFPALYHAADEASNEAQSSLLLFHKLNSIFLVLAAICALVSIQNSYYAIASAILFFCSLAAYAYSRVRDFQGRWYQARALAESVKTVTWRLIMSAEPFGKVGEEANLEEFRKVLAELLQDNKGIDEQLSGDWSQHDQITPEMRNVLSLPFADKRQFYLEKRIDDQRRWYAKKSGDNRKSSKQYFIMLCGIYAIAIILLLIRIANPETKLLPIDVLAVIASAIIGWMQIKRFNDLASAYGLTAHEVGIIKSRYESVKTNEHLSAFVSDAENAFSREHTQWAARRDH